jgi:hypothetical protein
MTWATGLLALLPAVVATEAAASDTFSVACHAQFTTTPTGLRGKLPAGADFDRCTEIRSAGEAVRRLPPGGGSPGLGTVVVDAFVVGYAAEDANTMWLRSRLLDGTVLGTPLVLWDLRQFPGVPRAGITHAVTLEQVLVTGVAASASPGGVAGTLSLGPTRIRWRAWVPTPANPAPPIGSPSTSFCFDLTTGLSC